ncbi:MAG: NAD(P)/FAD-dependent oxidoreductase [Candidatus Ranarchaeia archaeon]
MLDTIIMADVLVVGGGPAGLLTAITVAKYGFNVTVFEEHKVIGQPDHCAGILDIQGLQRLGISTRDRRYIQNTAYGAVFHGHDNTTLEIRSRQPKAVIVDRGEFDRYLSKKAEKKGVHIYTGERIKQSQIIREHGLWRIANHRDIPSSHKKGLILVCAEGFSAIISRRLGFSPPRPIIPAIQAILKLENSSLDPHLVHLYFDRRFAYNFFAWLVPIGEKKVKIGLATAKGSLLQRLKAFIKHVGLSPLERLSTTAHCILTGGPISQVVRDYVVVVGDVAGQVKPTTGGGVNLGGLCGQILGETLADALSTRTGYKSRLYAYEKRFRHTLGKEFRSMYFARRLLDRISDQSIARLLKDLKPYQNLIEEQGNIDFQSGIIDALKLKPRLILSGVRELFKDLFRPLLPPGDSNGEP